MPFGLEHLLPAPLSGLGTCLSPGLAFLIGVL
jgi:hypothetical protein